MPGAERRSDDRLDAPQTLRVPRYRSRLAARIEGGIRRSLGDSPGAIEDYAGPVGDPGLVGPDSMAWRVHADLPGMLIGGFAALMFQTLHPLAMAGVAAHSRFREDPLGRLQRTARFVAGTTFGAMPFVDDLIGEVVAVHARVRGIAPDGRPYSAADPELLTFVHVTEVSSFLAGFQRYSPRPLLRVEKDQYFDEVAEIARRLGASNVPTSLGEVRTYLEQILPELVRSAQSDEALEFLRRPIGTATSDAIAQRIIVTAAADLLPRPIRALITPSRFMPGRRAVILAAAGSFAVATRWAIGPSPVVARSLERVSTAP
ncbi:MAG TPA: oxygenase MpaB family protein [Acidimicrobiales bacterium]